MVQKAAKMNGITGNQTGVVPIELLRPIDPARCFSPASKLGLALVPNGLQIRTS